MTDVDTDVEELLQASSGECAVCEVDAHEVAFLYTLDDYIATNLGETPPVRCVELCAHHYDEVLEASALVEQGEVPGLVDKEVS